MGCGFRRERVTRVVCGNDGELGKLALGSDGKVVDRISRGDAGSVCTSGGGISSGLVCGVGGRVSGGEGEDICESEGSETRSVLGRSLVLAVTTTEAASGLRVARICEVVSPPTVLTWPIFTFFTTTPESCGGTGRTDDEFCPDVGVTRRAKLG